MSRSLKKGPFISVKLEKKVNAMEASGKKSVIKTWSRASMIAPEFVGHTFAVHNGNKFIPVYVTENMVGQSSANSPPLAPSVVMPATAKSKDRARKINFELIEEQK